MEQSASTVVGGRRRPFLAAVAVAALVVAACGPNAASQSPALQPSAAEPTAAASGGSTLPTDPLTIRMAYYNAGGQTEIDYRQKQAEAFMVMHPSVTVTMEPLSDWGEQIYPQIAAETAPDVIWADTDTGYGKMVGLGTYQPLDPFIEKDGYDISPWPAGIIDHFKDANGDLLLLPNSNLGFNFVYYNRKLFDEAGIPYPSNDWTVEDLLAAARKLTNPGQQWGLALAWNELYVTWMEMYGCKVGDDPNQPTKYTYNAPGCAKALEDLDKLSREKVLNWDFGSLGPGDTSGEQNFSLGHVGMLLSGTWEAPAIAANSGGAFEFDAAPAPIAQGGAIQGAASGFGMYAKTAHPEWAWELIKYIAGPEGQTADAKEGFGQSPIPAILDGVYCQADAPPANRCEIAKRGAENTVWEPVSDKWGSGFWEVISPAFEGGFTSDTPIDWQKLLDDLVVQSQAASPLP